MKSNISRFVLLVSASLFCSLPILGCGGSNASVSVTDDASAEQIADYEKMMQEAEDEANNDGSE